MAQKWRHFFSRHCHRAIIFYIRATATCATFNSSRQWRSGAVALKVAQVPSTANQLQSSYGTGTCCLAASLVA